MFVDENWINPTSSQWIRGSARLLGMRHKAEWDTTSLHSNKTSTRREPLENSSILTQTHTHPHSPPQLKSSHYAAKHQKSRLLLELHPLSTPLCTHLHATTSSDHKEPSPAGISKSLSPECSRGTSLFKNGPLRISIGGVALRWEGKRKLLVKYILYSSLCLEDYRLLPPTLESGIPTHLTLPQGS